MHSQGQEINFVLSFECLKEKKNRSNLKTSPKLSWLAVKQTPPHSISNNLKKTFALFPLTQSH